MKISSLDDVKAYLVLDLFRMTFWKIIIYTLLFLSSIVVVHYLYSYLIQETIEVNTNIRIGREEKFIKLSKGWTYYEYTGDSSGELVVLIHGGGIAGSHVWKKNKNKLIRAGYDVLTYDLYGRGYSDRPEVTYSPSLLLNQFEELLDSLQITTPFHVISLSLGSMIAVDYANKSPEKVQKMIYIDPVLEGNYRPNPLLYVPILSNYIMTVYWYPRALENQRKEFVNMKVFDEYATHLSYFMNFEGYKYVNFSTWMNTLQENYIPSLHKLGNKGENMLLIYGKKDPYFSHENTFVYSNAVPNIKIIGVKETGHMPHYENPQKVNMEIICFLKTSL